GPSRRGRCHASTSPVTRTAQSCVLSLPEGFRSADIIAYHLRDPMQGSETGQKGLLYKGMLWQGVPSRLELEFDNETVTARMDSPVDNFDGSAFTTMIRRMLGLDQDITAFEHAAAAHPEFGPLVQRQAGLRVPAAPTPYEALVWAVIGQQISVQAAVSIRRRFIAAAGIRHDSGLLCHPDAANVANMAPDALREAGLSAAKATTLSAL